MLEIRCNDCGALIPPERVEHDEAVRTLLFHVKHDDAYRVLCVNVSDHAALPAHPYADGQARDLCRDCTIKSLQAEPAELPTPDAPIENPGQSTPAGESKQSNVGGDPPPAIDSELSPRALEELNGPVQYMDGMTPGALARLKKLAPELIGDIDRDMCDKQCEFFDLINRTIGGNWSKTADVLEFAMGLGKPSREETAQAKNPQCKYSVMWGSNNVREFAEECERLASVVNGLHEMIRPYADGGSSADRTPAIPMCESVSVAWTLSVLESRLTELCADINAEAGKLFDLYKQDATTVDQPSPKAATPSADTTERGNGATSSQSPADVLVCVDELRSLCPKAFEQAKRQLDDGEFWTVVLQEIEDQVNAKGYSLLADIFRLISTWQPGEQHASAGSRTADGAPAATADDIREQVRQLAGLIEAAYLCESATIESQVSGGYLDAIGGAIRAARVKVRQLQDEIGNEGGAS